MKKVSFVLLLTIGLAACGKKNLDVDKQLDYCVSKAKQTMNSLSGNYSLIPRNIENGNKTWKCTGVEDWTSGFWPGTLWYLYEYSHDEKVKAAADSFTMALSPVLNHKAENHDLGFMIFSSFGNGYRLTKNEFYKKCVLQSSDTLTGLYNPKVGTILSWPAMVSKMNWPHNTIIDNMMNLEMLFWAAENSENKSLYQIADTHAQITMKNQFRPDFSCYHVIVYDTVTGTKIKGLTHQGYSDSSTWARGQAWAIYGFTMSYRQTRKPEYLDLALKAADLYLKRLPSDYIPFWDFDDPEIPNAPRDASAAAITASALLELSTFLGKERSVTNYFEVAKDILASLSTDKYLSGNSNLAFLLHSTGHNPNNSEVDASIIYADYYYVEALIRLKKIKEGKSIYEIL